MFKKAKTKAKKKPRKRSDSSGGYNLSDIIQSLPSTGQWKVFQDVFPDLIFHVSILYLIHLTCTKYYYMLFAGATEIENCQKKKLSQGQGGYRK